MERLKKWLFPLGAFMFGCLLLSMAFGDVMIHPNRFATEGGGDGLKSLYAFSHYVKKDKGIQFTGMNYPYGDHLFYPDAQPVLATTMGWINRNIAPVEQYTSGVSNIMMLFSVGFCALFLFLILKKLRLPNWYSLIFAGLIAALSPQIYRFIAHQALGQTVVVPMVWYFLLQFEDSRKRKWLWMSITILAVLFYGGIHLYYLALTSFFILAYTGVYTIHHIKRLKSKAKTIGMFLVMAIVPILITQVFIHLTDPALATRVKNPWGFFYYIASPESIFLPMHTPFEPLIAYYFKIPASTFEGYGSVGVVASLVLLFSLVRAVFFLIKLKPKRIFRITSNRRLNLYLWSAALLLMFSMGKPFNWGFEWILDFVPQLKQFRSVGRFNWAFFYVFTVYTSYYIFLIYKRFRQKKLIGFAISFLTIIVLLWWANDYAFLKYVRHYNSNSFKENFFVQKNVNYLDTLESAGFAKEDYQAIIALPFFHRGSEKIGMLNSTLAFDYGFRYAYHIDLPLVNSYLARAPITQAMQVGQLLSDTLIEKVVLKDFPNDKPLLAIFFEDKYQVPNEQEKYLISKGEYIASNGLVHFYKIPLSAFNTNKKPVQTRFKNKSNLFKQEVNNRTVYVSDTSISFLWYDGFEKETNKMPSSLIGKRSKQVHDATGLDLFNDSIPSKDTMLISVWIETDYLELYANLYYEVRDTTGNVVFRHGFNASGYNNYDRNWLRIEGEIAPQPSNYTHRLFLKNPKQIIADECLIRPKGSEVFWQANDSTLMYNNFRLTDN